MVLHIGQLITLLAQQLSKPIVNTFSAYAKHHPQFRYAVRRLGTGKNYMKTKESSFYHDRTSTSTLLNAILE